jgi:hypothetical protein
MRADYSLLETEKNFFFTFPIDEIIIRKETCSDIEQAISNFLEQHLPNHKFLVFANKRAFDWNFYCLYIEEREFKENDLYICIKKLSRQGNINSSVDSTSFKSYVEHFAEKASQQNKSTSEKAAEFKNKLEGRCNLNLISGVFNMSEEWA